MPKLSDTIILTVSLLQLPQRFEGFQRRFEDFIGEDFIPLLGTRLIRLSKM